MTMSGSLILVGILEAAITTIKSLTVFHSTWLLTNINVKLYLLSFKFLGKPLFNNPNSVLSIHLTSVSINNPFILRFVKDSHHTCIQLACFACPRIPTSNTIALLLALRTSCFISRYYVYIITTAFLIGEEISDLRIV